MILKNRHVLMTKQNSIIKQCLNPKITLLVVINYNLDIVVTFHHSI
jgi:hypothetical protein